MASPEDFRPRDEEGWRAFRRMKDAAWTGDVGTVRTLLAKFPHLLQFGEGNGYTLLHAAADAGRVDVATLLIDLGANVNALAGSCMPLHSVAASVQGEFPDLARLLVDRGAAVHAKTRDGANALYYASASGKARLVQLLVDAGADPNDSRGADGKSALAIAVEKGFTEIESVLLAAGSPAAHYYQSVSNDRERTQEQTMTPCAVCSQACSEHQLTRIASGQWLCRRCLTELRATGTEADSEIELPAELQRLRSVLTDLVGMFLATDGWFLPFGVGLTADGKEEPIPGFTGDEKNSDEVLRKLVGELQTSILSHRWRATGLCEIVTTTPPGSQSKTQAARMYLQSYGDGGLEVYHYVPYSKPSAGRVVVGKAFSKASKEGDSRDHIHLV